MNTGIRYNIFTYILHITVFPAAYTLNLFMMSCCTYRAKLHTNLQTVSYFSAFGSVFNCITNFFQNTTHTSLPKTHKSNRK